MAKKSAENLFDQAVFMGRVEEQRLRLDIPKKEVTAYVGHKKAQAYSGWRAGTRRLSVDQVIGICKLLELNPAWAVFNVGPRDAEEARTMNELRDIAKELKAGTAYRLKGHPEVKTQPFSTRDKLDVFKLSMAQRVDFRPVRLFRDLAAGYGVGENFEIKEDAFVQGLPGKGFTVAEVRGDSMVATLLDGDFVLLKDYPNGGYELPRIESEAEKISLDAWKRETRIDHMDIVVVEIEGQEGPTLKRVKYDTRRGPDQWKMLIAADNPVAWQDAWQVEVGDKITFYGKLVGLCEKV